MQRHVRLNGTPDFLYLCIHLPIDEFKLFGSKRKASKLLVF